MIKPVKKIAPYWYTPVSEEGNEEDPTRFKIKPLTPEQMDEVMHGAKMDGESMSLSAIGVKRALRVSVIDWENFDCKFTSSNISKIPWEVRQDLVGEIINGSLMDEDDEKN